MAYELNSCAEADDPSGDCFFCSPTLSRLYSRLRTKLFSFEVVFMLHPSPGFTTRAGWTASQVISWSKQVTTHAVTNVSHRIRVSESTVFQDRLTRLSAQYARHGRGNSLSSASHEPADPVVLSSCSSSNPSHPLISLFQKNAARPKEDLHPTVMLLVPSGHHHLHGRAVLF